MMDIKNKKLAVYTAAFSVLFLASVFSLLRSRGAVLDLYVFSDGSDAFMDFFNHISYVMEGGRTRVYDQTFNACFPPFAYLIYGFFGKLLPAGATKMYLFSETHPYALLLYVLRCCFLSVLLYASVQMHFGGRRKSALLITVCLMLSDVFFIHVLERGNSAWPVCILLMQAMGLRQSENPRDQETALLLIAAAAALKIYPAVFGLLYLAEKKWKQAARLLLYGILFFFVPFAFFGGVHGMIQFFRNQMTVQVSVRGLCNVYSLARMIGQGSGKVMIWYAVLAALFGLAFLFCLWQADGEWKKALILCLIMVLIPKWSGSYTVFYFAIPFVLYLNAEKKELLPVLTTLLFTGIFSCKLFGGSVMLRIGPNEPSVMNVSAAVRYACIWCLAILLLGEAIRRCVQRRRQNRALS